MKMIKRINVGEQSRCWSESASNSRSWSRLMFWFGSFSLARSESWLNLKSFSNSLPFHGSGSGFRPEFWPLSRSRSWNSYSYWIRK